METRIKIIEQGNSIDGIGYGARVYDAKNGTLLRLTSSPGCIHTDDSRGNYRIAMAEPDGDVTDLSDAELEALPLAEVSPESSAGLAPAAQLENQMDNTFSWAVDGQTYECERDHGACPFCFVAGSIVALPPPILAKQPDDTTHVCAPFFGGCNQGFAKDKAA